MDSQDVRQRWAERSGEYSPGYYAYYGPDETSEVVAGVLERLVGRGGRILEIGCSSGRHLAHLNDEGFERLHGVDINASALEVMRENFPDLAAGGTFHLDAVGDVVDDFDDGTFDAVYSVQTLQHIHPDDAEVFEEIARVTDELLITVENEGPSAEYVGGVGSDGDDDDHRGGDGDVGGEDEVTFVDDGVPLYHRDWNQVFTGLGFEEVESQSLDNVTLRAFRSTDG